MAELEKKELKIMNMVELVYSVLLWWEEHKYDSDGDRNRYDEAPDFVQKAMEAKRDIEIK